MTRPAAGWTRLRVGLPAVIALAALAVIMAAPARAAAAASPVPARPALARQHVVVVGIPGLRWSDVSPAATPTLWRLAGEGSVGSLVDRAVLPLTCPADGWLTLNGGARAQVRHGNSAPCPPLPAVVTSGGAARIPAMPSLISYNAQFHMGADWGLLASAASCATAVGPGAALALASPAGAVASYLPSPSAVTAGVLVRCPLTVIDLGTTGSTERGLAFRTIDAELARIVADLPAGATLLVTAPGAAAGPPHLLVTLVRGPGYRAGLLDASSTRRSGLVVLTDLTPTVARWLGSSVPGEISGAQLTRGSRGSLTSAVRSLAGMDVAEQVWQGSHTWFFWTYAAGDLVVFAGIALLSWGAAPERRRERARRWRVAGVFAAAVPAGTFLANLVPWWLLPHPAAWLYGLAVAWTAAIGFAAVLGQRAGRLGPLGPLGSVCLFTLVVLGLDVMAGSRLQIDTPFGLSMVDSGRYFGIGNEALGIYCVAALVGAGWLGIEMLRRYPGRRPAVLAVAAIGLFAVAASGWPGFGAKTGGTIAMVPCFLLLLLAVAGIRVSWRRAAPIAISGLALFAASALVSYFLPATGKSDIGTFAGNLLHGHGGELLHRKISSNIGSLAIGAYSPLVPILVLLTGLVLWRPAWFKLRAMQAAYAAEPLLRVILGVAWLACLIGWFADDSGVVVPAAALPFALPLGIAIVASVSYRDGPARYLGTAFAGPSVAGQIPR